MEELPLLKSLGTLTNSVRVFSSDVITPQEAIKILKEKKPNRDKMEREVLTRGYPAYTTQVGTAHGAHGF